MRPHPAVPTRPAQARIHPALRSFADECRDAAIRMLAYVGALALIGMVVFYAANPLTEAAISAATTPAERSDWSVATRSPPAFAVSQPDKAGRSTEYEILRHPGGGRKDVLRFGAAGQPPTAEIEIYRLGSEAPRQMPPAAELAARMDPGGTGATQHAGMIDTKFGPVTLLGLAGGNSPAAGCLGFVKPVDQAGLRIAGWSCAGDNAPQRRATIACLLDSLMLLSAGNDAAVAEVFAQAELRRSGCGPERLPTASTDWIFSGRDPDLRGRLSLN
ncbi:MAG: hypothetical protein HZA66_16250 [Rhodopseudomonas palustris]|uniref:Uncharacterized protein n=1 Tax=Rhodopseudomonas palustris TaxID=1076 RepID=A0A933RZE2_RHOPL|nr:hypothetical protein [Rhodopseudomonas palustris]